jgi:hypothetical protein
MGTWHSLLGVKWQRWETDRSSSFSAQVKNEWGHASAPAICLQGMHSDNFNFLLYFTYVPMVLHKTFKIVLFTSGKLMLGSCQKFRTLFKVNKDERNSLRIDWLGFFYCDM